MRLKVLVGLDVVVLVTALVPGTSSAGDPTLTVAVTDSITGLPVSGA
jgi:hypothetical protein